MPNDLHDGASLRFDNSWEPFRNLQKTAIWVFAGESKENLTEKRRRKRQREQRRPKRPTSHEVEGRKTLRAGDECLSSDEVEGIYGDEVRVCRSCLCAVLGEKVDNALVASEKAIEQDRSSCPGKP